MRDLNNCVPSLHPNSQRIESHDLRFLEVVDLDQAGDHTKAADRVEALFQDDIYDVRLASYVLSAAFYEDGPARLGEILKTTQAFMADDSTGAGESGAEPTYLAKATARLFRAVNDELSYQRSAKKKAWTQWSKNLTRAECDELVGHSLKLMEGMESPRFHSAADEVGKLLQVLRALQEQAMVQVEAPEDPATEATQNGRAMKKAAKKSNSKKKEKSGIQGDTEAKNTADAPENSHHRVSLATSTGSPNVELSVSPRFTELQEKLKAFEMLVEQKRFDRAALVADDVNQLISSFDPREYFPALFAGFAAKLNAHIGDIGTHWADKESLAWNTMAQFYRVDLAAFCKEQTDDDN